VLAGTGAGEVAAGLDAAGAAVVAFGLTTGMAGAEDPSCAASDKAHANTRKITKEPEPIFRIRTFWEWITLTGK